jgi:hypothetical protein
MFLLLVISGVEHRLCSSVTTAGKQPAATAADLHWTWQLLLLLFINLIMVGKGILNGVWTDKAEERRCHVMTVDHVNLYQLFQVSNNGK